MYRTVICAGLVETPDACLTELVGGLVGLASVTQNKRGRLADSSREDRRWGVAVVVLASYGRAQRGL